jgi:sulfatase maturation enzyme AslB (radical SAM superfamily)
MTESLVIVWRVYEPCNLACPFCGYSREIVRKRNIVSQDVILRFGRLLSEYQQAADREILVSWLGGEPLLWKDLSSISRIYHQDLALRLTVTTNGTLLGKDSIRSMLIDHYASVTISIDGFSDFHDLHRGQDGLFERVRQSVAKMKEEIKASNSPLKLRVNTVLMRSNIADFERLCMEVADWGIDELTFNQLGGFEIRGFFDENRLLPEQAEWLKQELPGLQQKARARGLKIFSGDRYLERILATSRNVAIPIDDCAPGAQYLFVNENNMASPCSFTSASYGIPISEIQTLSDMIKLPELFRMKRQREKVLSCRDCHSTQVFGKFN